ncbi:hypothetical protein FB451DRAFT_1198540 [Mycena latifolia]|nr:hypothetical protein FB451DRAFT_1198540 [Mycena latifolia]
MNPRTGKSEAHLADSAAEEYSCFSPPCFPLHYAVDSWAPRSTNKRATVVEVPDQDDPPVRPKAAPRGATAKDKAKEKAGASSSKSGSHAGSSSASLTIIPKDVVSTPSAAAETSQSPPPGSSSEGTIVPASVVSSSVSTTSSVQPSTPSPEGAPPPSLIGSDQQGSPSARSSSARSASRIVSPTRASPSPTPSLTSLFNAPLSAARSISQRSAVSVRWDQSISNASGTSRIMKDYPPLFKGPAAVFELYDEPLHSSVERYHELYDPESVLQYDPLVRFGALDGRLPNRSSEESIALRDVLIRYTSPHLELIWETLSDGIAGLLTLHHPSAFLRSLEREKGQPQLFCISPDILVVFGHICLAVQQVLDGLAQFLNKSDRQRFVLDPRHRFLLLMEGHDSRSEIAFAFLTLQTRLRNADIHIKNYLNSIQQIFTNTISDERISSVDSTVSDVRSEFHRGATLPELYKLLARPDYAAAVKEIAPERIEVGLRKLEMEGQLPEQFYKKRGPRPLPTIREASPSPLHGAEPGATRDGSGEASDQRRDPPPHMAIPMPSSISAAPRSPHAITSLPGVERIPDFAGLPGAPAVFGGPSTMRPGSYPRRKASHPRRALFRCPRTGPRMPTRPNSTVLPPVPPEEVNAVLLLERGARPRETAVIRASEAAAEVEAEAAVLEEAEEATEEVAQAAAVALDPRDDPGSNPEGASGPTNLYPEEWQVNHKLNMSSVPSWDGEGVSAILYLSKMARLARMGAKMRKSLGNVAPLLFSGAAEVWWRALTEPDQDYFSQEWLMLLYAIREQFLTEGWRHERTLEFEEMRFRENGRANKDETPGQYLQRCITHYQALYDGDDADGPAAIFRILRNQPVEWNTILNDRACPSIFTLQKEASHNKDALIAHWELHQQVETVKAAIAAGGNAMATGGGGVEKPEENRSVRNASDSEDDDPSREVQVVDNRRGSGQRGSSGGPAKPKYRDWPKGGTVDGVQFTRRDDVKSERQPNGECYICTSGNHFAQRLPMVRKMGNHALGEHPAIHTGALAAHSSPYGSNRAHRRRISGDRKGKGKEANHSPDSERYAALPSQRRVLRKNPKVDELPFVVSADGTKVYTARQKRVTPEGYGSLGARALHFAARVGSLDAPVVKARSDSGADITLMSEDFWKTIPDAPKIKEGMKMKLFHLTGRAKVLGYVRTKLFTADNDGAVISFDLEAYVVWDMRVPLLIGEDFHTSYEIGVQRWSTGRTELHVGDSAHYIPASSTHGVDVGFEIRKANLAKAFIRAKAGNRARAKGRRDGRTTVPTVVAAEDALIAAGLYITCG